MNSISGIHWSKVISTMKSSAIYMGTTNQCESETSKQYWAVWHPLAVHQKIREAEWWTVVAWDADYILKWDYCRGGNTPVSFWKQRGFAHLFGQNKVQFYGPCGCYMTKRQLHMHLTLYLWSWIDKGTCGFWGVGSSLTTHHSLCPAGIIAHPLIWIWGDDAEKYAFPPPLAHG